MVAHTVNPSSQEAAVGRCLEFKASLVYMVRSRPVRTAQWEPVSEQQSAEGAEAVSESFHSSDLPTRGRFQSYSSSLGM